MGGDRRRAALFAAGAPTCNTSLASRAPFHNLPFRSPLGTGVAEWEDTPMCFPKLSIYNIGIGTSDII